jgi:lipoate-protein ligase A
MRLLQTGRRDCRYNMGLDEALLESVARGAPPVVRFYGWQPAAVSVGYFQGIEEEVDTRACRGRGVDVVRRITGGGAVFHHAELTYSVVFPASHPLAGASLQESYRVLCAGVVRGLALLGLAARFVPVNDIVVSDTAGGGGGGERKISGSAQTRRMQTVLHHGTVLLDLDADLMFSLLRAPAEKTRDRLVRDAKARVTSLRDQGVSADFDAAQEAMAEGFRQALGIEYAPGSPLPDEEARARELAAAKFAAPEWIYRR